MTQLIVDGDFLKYTSAAVGEKRTVEVIHKSTGKKQIFNNRTEFWGRGKKVGGWLGDVNKERGEAGKPLFVKEDFEFVDIQTPEPIENVLHTVKMQVEGIVSQFDRPYKIFLGKGDVFRKDLSTILEYKGNRKDMLRPVHLDAVHEYLIRKYKAEEVTHIETDDRCVMECYKTNNILVGVDKDYYGCPVHFFNTNRPEEGVVDCNGFGKLWRNTKGDVRGNGRLFFYFQVLSGDEADNYAANSASEKTWGDVSAFNALSQATNDKEALQAVVDVYRNILYPEPKKIKGWRGNEFDIDWLYVLRENWDLARMLRFEGDTVTANTVLSKLGIYNE